METEFKSLQQVIEYVADPSRANELSAALRWPNGVTCPHCGVIGEAAFMVKYSRYKCRACRKQFTIKMGTPMEDSPLPLKTWIAGMWLICNAKNGISSCEIARALNITQKSAWFLLHRIRLMMTGSSTDKMSGPVEADETYIGGLEKNKHSHKKLNKGRGGVGKQIVMGVLQRAKDGDTSKIRAKVITNTTKDTLHGEVRANVQPGAKLMTDAHQGYRGLSEDLEHAWVDHLVKYVEGAVHTNGCENFWSLFKRMLHGTYTHVDPRHLQQYVEEEVYRFNNRKDNDTERFLYTMGLMHGKRLQYKELIERGLQFMLPE